MSFTFFFADSVNCHVTCSAMSYVTFVAERHEKTTESTTDMKDNHNEDLLQVIYLIEVS